MQKEQQKLNQEQQKSFVKKETNNRSSCDNPISSSNNIPSKSFQQPQQQCVQAGSKRSYVQAMEDTKKNVEKRASNPNNIDGGLTSAFQHPPTNSDRNHFYSGNTNKSGNNQTQLQRHRQQEQQQQQQQNQLGNSSRSGKKNY